MQFTKTYKIAEVNKDRLVEKIDTINRKLDRLNLPMVVITVDSVFFKTYPATWHTPERIVKFLNITLSGQKPEISGYEFIATLQHIDGHVILRGIPGGEEIPASYRNADPKNCDHCQTRRDRSNTYILRNTKALQYLQVGSACLDTFLGKDSDPHAIAKGLQWLQDLAVYADTLEADEDGEAGGSGQKTYFEINKFMAHVASACRMAGFVSKAKARENEKVMSTVDLVLSQLNPATRENEEIDFDEDHVLTKRAKNRQQANFVDLVVTDQDKELAQASLSWARSITDVSNDYLYNVQTVSQLEYLDLRTVGIAASIVSAYQRSVSDAQAQAMQNGKISNHVGTVGSKFTAQVSIVGKTAINGHYGTTYLYRFIDQDGNKLSWFASKPAIDTEKVKDVTITGTVKKHDEYRGTKQTVLTRCKVA
jgi:hypothetical protein